MEESVTVNREEKLWADVRGYRVATNNARILGQLEELIINEKTGKIVDIVIRTSSEKNINIKGAKTKGDYLLVPFSRVEKVGEFIIVAE
ncbi:MAG: PRC-barrel domain-containing protein [Methanobrevibacter sp.]|jgi:sporulation protein YlmC with PRC-barrel domain|nr:PRC-barrel domain-containing protein [Candidatus Methanovirga meridionalis]